MPAKKAGASGTPAKKAGGIRDASQESRRRQGRMYPAFLCSRKPPAGRVGAYRIRPPTRPGIRGECVFLVFKHRFIVIQTRFKRHSNSSLGTVGEGRMRYAPTPVRASCTQLSWLASLTPPASAEAGKLAGYLKSPYQANFAGVRRRPPASADAPWIGASEL